MENNKPNQSQKPNPTRSATQKIADLENAVLSLYGVADNLAKDLTTAKGALKLLNNKVSSIMKAFSAGEDLTDEVIGRIMTENSCEELAQKVASMVAQNLVVTEDAISANSFVVVSELDDTDQVVNPRLQFSLRTLPQAIQDKLLGVKVGSVILIEEGKLKVKVLESYAIQDPQTAPAAAPEATAPAAATQPEDAAKTQEAPVTAPAADSTAETQSTQEVANS